MKKALVTGITGQDGRGVLRNFCWPRITRYTASSGARPRSIRNELIIFTRIPTTRDRRRLFLHYGDMTDSANLAGIMQVVRPDEIYNLAAQSHVAVSFETPEYTANVDGLGTLRILEAMRAQGLKSTRFYQASTSELYGLTKESPQTESTPFHPRSPYSVAKLYAYWITVNYREAYGIYACNGILFNHESSIRGETFVTRKITRGLARVKVGLQDCVYLGTPVAGKTPPQRSLERWWGIAAWWVPRW